jgi:hypothetical protein
LGTILGVVCNILVLVIENENEEEEENEEENEEEEQRLRFAAVRDRWVSRRKPICVL